MQALRISLSISHNRRRRSVGRTRQGAHALPRRISGERPEDVQFVARLCGRPGQLGVYLLPGKARKAS